MRGSIWPCTMCRDSLISFGMAQITDWILHIIGSMQVIKEA